MSSKRDGKPLGNEGQPQVLNEQPAEQPEMEMPFEWQSSHVQLGYELLEAIIREQHRHLLSAFASNVRRHGLRDRLPDAATAGTAIGAGMASGHLLLGAAAGGLAFVWRSLVETIRLRRNNHASDNQAVREVRMFMLHLAASLSANSSAVRVDKVPRVEEFQNLWVRHSWRLVHCLKGYNIRHLAIVQTLQTLERTEEEDKAANELLYLIRWFRPRLTQALLALEDLYVSELKGTKGKLKAMAAFNERIEEMDPFQDGDKLQPSLDWLPMTQETLIRRELPKQLEKDREAVMANREVHVQQIDRDLARLEPEHGPAVDAFIRANPSKPKPEPDSDE